MCVLVFGPASPTRRFFWVVWGATVLAVGCGPAAPPPRERSQSEQNLTEIHRAYKLAEMNLHRPPKSLDEIKPFFEEDDPKEYLTSPDDKKPYVIIWGTTTNLGPAHYKQPAGAGASAGVSLPILAYEKVGSGGKRHVINIMGMVSVVSDDQFKNATFPAGHKPQ
jgi:hypothetical protein